MNYEYSHGSIIKTITKTIEVKVCAYTFGLSWRSYTSFHEETASDEGTPLLLGVFSSFFGFSRPDLVMHRVDKVDDVEMWFLSGSNSQPCSQDTSSSVSNSDTLPKPK